MRSKDYFIINGEQSSNDFGLYVDTPPMQAMAEQHTSEIKIADREESLFITYNSYNDITLNITAYSFENSFNISAVYAWLRTAKTLKFNAQADRYYKVKKLMGIVPNYSGNGKNIITISMIVSPFKYFTNDAPVTSTAKQFNVENAGNIYCRPVYTIAGSGDITIGTVDAQGGELEKLTIYGVNGGCTVDVERLMVTKDKVSLKSAGMLPILQAGTNKIVVTGAVTSVSVKRNQRDV